MDARPDNDDIVINLRAWWALLRRRRRRVAAIATTLFALALPPVLLWPDAYRAESTILVESRNAKVVSIEEVYDINAQQSEYFQTQYEVLKSRELAEKVIAELGLEQLPAFNPALRRNDWLPWQRKELTKAEIHQAALQVFADSLEVKPLRNTQLVTISFSAGDPQLAADILNTLGKLYIESDLQARLDVTREAASWINSRLAGLRQQLEQSEKALQDYRERENLLEVEGVRTLATQELNELTTKLVEARRKRTEAENIVAQIGEDTTSNPAVLQHPLVQRLREQEAAAEQKLSELAKRYGPQHPKIIAVNSELDAARASYNQQVAKVIEGVRREYEIARATEEALNRALDSKKSEMQDINRKEYKLSELERTVTVNRELYDTFFSRMKETSETENLQTAHARIIDHAIAPTEPDSPARTWWLLAAALLGLSAGVATVLWQAHIDNTLDDPDDVQQGLGEILLGIVPLLPQRDSVASLYGRDSSSAFAEAIRTVRTALLVGLRQAHCAQQVLLVTSAMPGEGKSVLASNLAAAFGQMGKTLLIDADLRRPAAARQFAVPTTVPGLSALLSGQAPLPACIHHDAVRGFDILPAGLLPAQPLELLSSPVLAQQLLRLREQYEHIVIDSAPCEAVSDALVLSVLVDGVVHVVHAGVTDRRAITSAIQRLRAAGARLLGVVLNQVDIERGQRAGYYYGGYYPSTRDDDRRAA